MKRIITAFMLIFYCLTLISCDTSDSNYIDYTERTKYELFIMLENASYSNRKDILNELIDKQSGECYIDEQVVTEYLETHTVEQLVEYWYNIFDEIYSYYQYHVVPTKDSATIAFDEARSLMISVINMAGIEVKPVDLTTVDTPGFYSENSSNYPKYETYEVSGKFYNKSGTNVHYETKTCVKEFIYYGDFAIQKDSGYKYNEGRYEWVNGVFYDELPSWTSYERGYLYYKDTEISLDHVISYYGKYPTRYDTFLNIATNLSYFVVGDYIYIIHNNKLSENGMIWTRYELKQS